MQAAPQLTSCHAVVLSPHLKIADARRMLRNEPPFQPLRLRALRMRFEDDADEAVLGVAADLAAHASLQRVVLCHEPLHMLAALDAVVDAALARQLVSLGFWYWRLTPAAAPALARLLSGSTLKALTIVQMGQLLDGPSAALLGDALRANSTLTSFSFDAHLWQNADAAAALLSALTGHRSLRALKLAFNRVLPGAPAAGAPLGALVAANASALTQLNVGFSDLGDAGLRPLFEALPANTHLRNLDVSHNDMSEAFTRDVLLPAVRANASLTLLCAPTYGGAHPGAAEAIALVAARGAAAAAAQ
jgi:hypothetical protein